MELNEILETLKEQFPNKAIDLIESLELLSDTIQDAINEVQNKITQACGNRDWDLAKQHMNLAENIAIYEKQLENMKSLLEPEQEVAIIPEEDDEQTEQKVIPNYNEYLVDMEMPHTLYEDYTHKRPYAFVLNEKQKVEVKTWQEMLLKTCEILASVDREKFASFQSDIKMNGKKVRYFSADSSKIRKPVTVQGTDIYIETNMSSNGIRNLIVKMLQQYGMKISDFKLFLRADYSALHQE